MYVAGRSRQRVGTRILPAGALEAARKGPARSAVVAVDHRDSRTPHALTGDEPVVKPVVDPGLAHAGLLQPGNDLVRGSFHRRTVEHTAVHHRALFLGGPGFGQGARSPVRSRNHPYDIEPKAFGKGEVAFVVPGHPHDGARTVAQHHVVRNPD